MVSLFRQSCYVYSVYCSIAILCLSLFPVVREVCSDPITAAMYDIFGNTACRQVVIEA